MIPDSAIEAAHKAWREQAALDGSIFEYNLRAAIEAAAAHVEAEADLMRWKLDALKEWADAMINTSNSPQYGHDVRTLLNVSSLGEAQETDYL